MDVYAEKKRKSVIGISAIVDVIQINRVQFVEINDL